MLLSLDIHLDRSSNGGNDTFSLEHGVPFFPSVPINE